MLTEVLPDLSKVDFMTLRTLQFTESCRMSLSATWGRLSRAHLWGGSVSRGRFATVFYYTEHTSCSLSNFCVRIWSEIFYKTTRASYITRNLVLTASRTEANVTNTRSAYLRTQCGVLRVTHYKHPAVDRPNCLIYYFTETSPMLTRRMINPLRRKSQTEVHLSPII